VREAVGKKGVLGACAFGAGFDVVWALGQLDLDPSLTLAQLEEKCKGAFTIEEHLDRWEAKYTHPDTKAEVAKARAELEQLKSAAKEATGVESKPSVAGALPSPAAAPVPVPAVPPPSLELLKLLEVSDKAKSAVTQEDLVAIAMQEDEEAYQDHLKAVVAGKKAEGAKPPVQPIAQGKVEKSSPKSETKAADPVAALILDLGQRWAKARADLRAWEKDDTPPFDLKCAKILISRLKEAITKLGNNPKLTEADLVKELGPLMIDTVKAEQQANLDDLLSGMSKPKAKPLPKVPPKKRVIKSQPKVPSVPVGAMKIPPAPPRYHPCP
jgi:hypothetical protein